MEDGTVHKCYNSPHIKLKRKTQNTSSLHILTIRKQSTFPNNKDTYSLHHTSSDTLSMRRYPVALKDIAATSCKMANSLRKISVPFLD